MKKQFSDYISLFESIYSSRKDYVLILDYDLCELWKNKEELPEAFSCRRYEEKIHKDSFQESGKYSLDYNNEKYEYRLTVCPDIADGIYIIEFDGKDIITSLLENDYVKTQFVYENAAKRESLYGITSSLQALYQSLEETELYDETDLLNVVGKRCYDIMRVNALLYETIKLMSDYETQRIDYTKLLYEFVWASANILRRSPIRISHNIEQMLYIRSNYSITVYCMLTMLKYAIRTNPGRMGFNVTAKLSDKSVLVTITPDDSGIDSETLKSNLRPLNPDESEDISYAELHYIRNFCSKLGGTVYINNSSQNGRTIGISLPEYVDTDTTISLCSVQNEFRSNRFTPFHIELSEICEVNYF